MEPRETDDLPLVPPTPKIHEVPAEMVLEIACGMERPLDIAHRYGYSDQEFDTLTQWPEFGRQVEAKKLELKTSGHTFRLMTGWMAEDLAKDLYRKAKGNDATLPQVHDVFKTMAKLADLEPKQVAAAAGTGFSIQIVFGDKQAKPIDVQAKEIPE
jgi:hypothetical protein